MDYTWHYTSPLGTITMASDGTALVGLWFDCQKYFPETLLSGCREEPLKVFDEAERWLDVYFTGKAPDFLPVLNPRATVFRRTVWEILLTIPYGQTMTYGEVAALAAKRLGRPGMSAQAAGNAVGHNPISLIIPCHRVIGANGSLTGYAGGLDRKAWLLDLEKGVRKNT